MAQTFQATFNSDGDRIDYTPVGAVACGAVVVDGQLFGIAVRPIAAGELGALCVDGVIEIVKVNGTLTRGALVFWDANGNPQGGTAGTGAATTDEDSGNNVLIGRVVQAVTVATVETVKVKIGFATDVTNTVTVQGGTQNAIADPGDAGAIPVTNAGYVPIVTGGSETRTLAIPSFIGQELVLYIKTDGGTCVITVASAINQTGNNTITMAEVRDCIRLMAIESGSNKVWDIVCNNGCALSTV